MSSLARKAFAEALGTLLLVATVIGSGIAAQLLSPHDVGLQLLENALITGAVLVAMILTLGSVSAVFNPLVALSERLFGAITTRDAGVFIAAQFVGGAAGAVMTDPMFDRSAVQLSTHDRTGGGLWLGEVVATCALLPVIFGVVRGGRGPHVAYAVAGAITAMYWATSSASFANPTVTVARTLSNTFAGIARPRYPASCSRSWPAPPARSGCSIRTRPQSPVSSPHRPSTATSAPLPEGPR